jgi:alkylation response protein AidB-like acyl-CoA dehydrogenase
MSQTTHLISTAAAWTNELRSLSESIESAGSLPASLADKLGEQGFFRMLAPAENGGLEISPGEFVDTLETLALGDAATAWCVMTGATTGLATGWLGPQGAADIWQDRNVPLAGIYAPMGKVTAVDGGYQLTGQWPFASGCNNAKWLMGGALIEHGGTPLPHALFFSAEDIEILDTWDVLGLSGTGSNDIRVNNIFVPESRVCSFFDTPTQSGPLYAYPVFGLLAHGVAAVATGIAQNALRQLIDDLAAGTRRGANDSVLQQDIAQLTAKLESARAWVKATLSETWETAQQGESLSVEDRAQLRLSANHAADSAADVVNACYRLGGGAALYKRNPLQRHLRDIQTLMQHIMVNPAIYRVAGKALLGQELNASEL